MCVGGKGFSGLQCSPPSPPPAALSSSSSSSFPAQKDIKSPRLVRPRRHTTPAMAADRTETALEEQGGMHSSDLDFSPDHGCHIPKRHARVTVKYNRKELQKRLDVEKWIDESLDQLYSGQEADMPEELNIDDLIDLPNDEERVRKLRECLQNCSNNTENFITEMVAKLDGVHKQKDLQSEGIEHPVIGHSHHRHEPYHFNNPHHHHQFHHSRSQNQTL